MHGRNLTEPDELADRWREYCEDVYIAEVTRNVIDERQENEPSPLRSEVIRPYNGRLIAIALDQTKLRWNYLNRR